MGQPITERSPSDKQLFIKKLAIETFMLLEDLAFLNIKANDRYALSHIAKRIDEEGYSLYDVLPGLNFELLKLQMKI